MSRFSDWFEQESGYALHRFDTKHPLRDCCGQQPVLTENGILEYLPKCGETMLPLYRCTQCGAFLIRSESGWHRLDHILKYRVVKRNEDRGSGIDPSADGGDGRGRL